MNDDKLIDLASSWVSSRDGAYLAKENVIVYYTSLTGRKRDFDWVTLTLAEVVRIIKSTELSVEDSDKLFSRHIIAACQELDRVFEFGVKSQYDTKPTVFNYFKEATMDLGDIAMSLLAEELYSRGYFAVPSTGVYKIATSLCNKCKLGMSSQEMRESVFKHMTTDKYEIRSGTYRPMFKGRKRVVFMTPDTKPKDIREVEPAIAKAIEKLIRIKIS